MFSSYLHSNFDPCDEALIVNMFVMRSLTVFVLPHPPFVRRESLFLFFSVVQLFLFILFTISSFYVLGVIPRHIRAPIVGSGPSTLWNLTILTTDFFTLSSPC